MIRTITILIVAAIGSITASGQTNNNQPKSASDSTNLGLKGPRAASLLKANQAIPRQLIPIDSVAVKNKMQKDSTLFKLKKFQAIHRTTINIDSTASKSKN